jgi:hypothetical protein
VGERRPVTRNDAFFIAQGVVDQLGDDARRLKAVHVIRKITDGVITIRVFLTSVAPDDPEPFIFTPEEFRW